MLILNFMVRVSGRLDAQYKNDEVLAYHSLQENARRLLILGVLARNDVDIWTNVGV
jgi:hypothetical protein